jgi:hypothetical protein
MSESSGGLAHIWLTERATGTFFVDAGLRIPPVADASTAGDVAERAPILAVNVFANIFIGLESTNVDT